MATWEKYQITDMLNYHIFEQPWPEVRDRLLGQAVEQLKEPLRGQLIQKIWFELWNSLHEQMHRQVWEVAIVQPALSQFNEQLSGQLHDDE
jgi:hypothetical protein